MSDLKRDEIKYVRDICKAAYEKQTSCYICGATENLEFHHYNTMTLLWAKWKKLNDITITCVDDILEQRLVFKEAHKQEVYKDSVTLCYHHHKEKLHKVYGKAPLLSTAGKQARWVEKQKVKFNKGK
mgnify:CR=1 FL=1